MNDVLPPDAVISHAPAGRDWRKSASDHVAYALLVYTALQIFVTVHALRRGAPGLLPYLALAILIIAIIPSCRRFEKRWVDLPDEQAFDPSLASSFRRDIRTLWAIAIGLPFLLTGIFKLIFAIFL